MIYPNKLNDNDVIKIISPSNGVTKNKMEKYENAIKYLNSKNFTIVEDKYVRCSVNNVSSTGINRGKEFNISLTDKNVKALIACSGGNYLIEMIDYVKFSFINILILQVYYFI